MPISPSPLRYPGGKSSLTNFLGRIIEENKLLDGVYVEPYAGGAGAAMNLLFSEYVSKIVINDLDRHIYELWNSVLNRTDDLIHLIRTTEITIDEWKKQRNIYRKLNDFSGLEVGFSTFFLNRCNRSGILKGGVIGGKEQKGKWKLNARFNKDELIKKIEKISMYKNRIILENKDAISLIKNKKWSNNTIMYLDPPYYEKGSGLYLNHYTSEDHKYLSQFIKRYSRFRWIISYDNVEEIKFFYRNMRQVCFDVNYTSHTYKKGTELMIFDPKLKFSENCLSLLENRKHIKFEAS